MNKVKREAIVQLVENYNGVWPEDSAFIVTYAPNFMMGLCEVYREEFEQVAREEGWVNGYKWGVEYPTNGEKPDLPDDVEYQVFYFGRWDEVNRKHASVETNWPVATKFRIVDDRYKPKSDALDGKTAEQSESDNWHERGELPPVGERVDVFGEETDCEVVAHVENCAVIRMSYGLGCFEPHELQPAQSERDKCISHYANKVRELLPRHIQSGYIIDMCGALYDIGAFKLPEDNQ